MHRQRQTGQPGQQNRRRGGRGGVRRRKAQAARRADIDRDRRDDAAAGGAPIRLISTAAACAANAPAPATSHSRRRCGLQERAERRHRQPAEAVLTEVRHRPGDRQRAGAVARTPTAPRPARRLRRSASPIQPRCRPLPAALLAGQQHRLPLLLAGQHRQRGAVDPAHLVEAAQQPALAAQRLPQQREHLVPVTLAVDDAPAVGRGDGDAVDVAQQEPAGVLRRHVQLRTLMMLRRQSFSAVQRSRGPAGSRSAAVHRRLHLVRCRCRRRRQLGRADGSTTASGYSLAHPVHLGQRGFQDREDVLRARRGSRRSPCSGSRPSNTQGTEGVSTSP